VKDFSGVHELWVDSVRFVGTAGVGVLAYRLEGSPWRWPLVALVLAGLGTIAGIFWIRNTWIDRPKHLSRGVKSEGRRAAREALKGGQ